MRVTVKGNLIAELRRVVVDNRGQRLEGGDDLVFATKSAIGEVGDLEPILAWCLGIDQAKAKVRGQGEHVIVATVDEFTAELACRR